MKRKKQILKISLISLILFVVLGMCNTSRANVLGDIATGGVIGIAGLLTLGIQYFLFIIANAVQLIIAGVTGLADGNAVFDVGEVIFNKTQLTITDFFPTLTGGVGTNETIINNIAKYYNIMRGLAIAILLGVLLYIGIRMAISTVASEEAKYKKMLIDWTVSLILVFVLHYIIIITFYINDVLVKALSTLEPGVGLDYGELIGHAAIPIAGWPSLAVYISLVVCTLAFILLYIKRMITLGFLIVISPLITITYSIDKMGDGKSQALNTWLKEFIFNVIIQPFHCIIYLVFVSTSMKLLSTSMLDLGNQILAVMCMFFLLKSEGIVKKIFGIKADSMGDALSSGAMAVAVMSGLAGKAAKKGAGSASQKMPTMENNKSAEGKTKVKEEKGNKDHSDDNSPNPNHGDDSGEPQPKDDHKEPPQEGNDTETQAKKVKEKKIGDAINNSMFARSFRRKGGLPGYLSRQAEGAAAVFGAIAGATVGDTKTAISTAVAAKGLAGAGIDKLNEGAQERKLEENQRVFAGAYEDFAREYKKLHEDADEQTIRAAAKNLYEGGGHDLENEFERDFYTQMEQLATSAEIRGFDDGFDYVNESMQLHDAGLLKPNKRYIPKEYGSSN